MGLGNDIRQDYKPKFSNSLIKLLLTSGGQRIGPHSQFLFVSLAPHLLNDESAECRKAVSSTLGALLSTLQEGGVETLKRSTVTWLGGQNPAHAQLACRILCIFADTLGKQAIYQSLKYFLYSYKLEIYVE